MRVTAPNTKFTGRVGRDHFVDGQCADGSPEQEAYYRRRGYTINPPAGAEKVTVPAGSASRAAWAEFLESQGIDVPDGARRDELRDLWEENHAEVAY